MASFQIAAFGSQGLPVVLLRPVLGSEWGGGAPSRGAEFDVITGKLACGYAK